MRCGQLLLLCFQDPEVFHSSFLARKFLEKQPRMLAVLRDPLRRSEEVTLMISVLTCVSS
jgi:hypothetical protein